MSAVLPSSRVHARSALARWDLLFIVLASAHGLLLLTWPSIPLLAITLWWGTNTVAHNFIHRPFFQSRWMNAAFSSYLSVLFGFPQSLWRDRHLAHHAGLRSRLRLSWLLALEILVVILLWVTLVTTAPVFTWSVYLPGWLAGLALCQLQGYFEHRGETTSHYGQVYNMLFFNDGYHREHHARPGVRWRELPRFTESDSRASRWPAVLRWIECLNLCLLERAVLHSSFLQRVVIGKHERAMRQLLHSIPRPASVGIVGGGLFPRTALILERLLPDSRLVLIDLSLENLSIASRFLTVDAVYLNQRFDASQRSDHDLLIVPLALIGDREAIYANPPADHVFVHDWIWRRRGESAVVSWLLLKRLNLVRR